MSNYADIADWDGKHERLKRISTGGKYNDAHIPATEIKYREGERHNAIRWIASNAKDADDCSLLLDMLGLRVEEGIDVHSRSEDAQHVTGSATGCDQ